MKTSSLRMAARMALPVMMLIAAGDQAGAQDTRPADQLPSPPKPSSIDVPKLNYTQFTLPNGLRVIMHEDHSSPIVSVEVLYHVGSKNDVPGKSGMAHMLEHMLDEQTLNLPAGEYRRLISDAGGLYEAHTQTDWTQSIITMPSNHLATALWLEAETMANLSPALDTGRYNSEREAVRNEYRTTFLNSAANSGGEAMFEALFDNGTYRLPLIGHLSDLASTTVEDLRAFYDKYYVPNNAVVVIAGDFTSANARQLVTKHFGPIPRGKPVVQPTDAGTLRGEKRIVVEHSSGQRQLWVAWRGASSGAADRAAATALNAILVERLRRVLVTERKLSPLMSAAYNMHFDLESSGVIQVAALVNGTAPGSSTEVERLIDSVVTAIRENGVTAQEVKRWVASYRMQALLGMQSVAEKAHALADPTLTQGNPSGNLLLIERAISVTPAQVSAAAKKYLTDDRVVMNIIPTGKFDLISKPTLPYTNASRK